MLNCAKETKIYTVLHIDNTKRRGIVKLKDQSVDEEDPIILDKKRCPGVRNYDVTEFFVDAIYTEANAMSVAARFSLPGFSEIDLYMAKHYPSITSAAQGQPVDPASGKDLTRDFAGNPFKE